MGRLFVWFDMDGVLNRYDRSIYRGEKPLYLKKGLHYYRNAPADSTALKMLKYVSSLRGVQYRIITCLPDGEIFYEHLLDKKYWLSQNAPYAEDRLVSCIEDKYGCAEAVLGSRDFAKYTNILIDDFNSNLLNWQESGGISIKYLNGVNSGESWGGYAVRNLEDLKFILKNL